MKIDSRVLSRAATEYRPDQADDAVDIRVRYPTKDRGVGALDLLRTARSVWPL